jgi:hypothetical protein
LVHSNGIFSAANTAEFGSATSPNIDEIAVSVCQTLATKCKAPDVTLGECSTAASDAIGAGDTAAAVDTFNSVLGIQVSSRVGIHFTKCFADKKRVDKLCQHESRSRGWNILDGELYSIVFYLHISNTTPVRRPQR